MITDCYYQYNITTRVDEKRAKQVEKIKPPKEKIYKYIFKCECCGEIIKRQKNSDFVKRYKLYRCGSCGGKFIQIK